MMKWTWKTVSVGTWRGRGELQGERMEGRMDMEKTKEEVKVNDVNKERGKCKIQTEKEQK